MTYVIIFKKIQTFCCETNHIAEGLFFIFCNIVPASINFPTLLQNKMQRKEKFLPLRSLSNSSSKLGVSFVRHGLINCHKNCSPLTDKNNLAFSTGNGCVEKISFQHDIEALHHWNDDRFEFGPLTFMNGDRICKSDILHFFDIVPEHIRFPVKADAAKLIVVLVLLYLNDKACLAVGYIFGVFRLHHSVA